MVKPERRQPNKGAEPVLSLTKEPALLPRGGKRPGAGAPRGNLNALKDGRRSRQLRALFAALSQVPLFRTLLFHHYMKAAPKPSRAKLRRLYLQLLAHSITGNYIQSNGTPHSSLQPAEKIANNQNPLLSDLVRGTHPSPHHLYAILSPKRHGPSPEGHGREQRAHLTPGHGPDQHHRR